MEGEKERQIPPHHYFAAFNGKINLMALMNIYSEENHSQGEQGRE